MKQAVSDTYNIAWFKLAECVSRGEKERALGVYRLLAHSIDDAAFAKQLEGDILLSFNERTLAEQRYRDSAHLYKESGRILEAAAIFEHLYQLDRSSDFYKSSLIELYTQLDVPAKIKEHSEAK